MEQYIVALITVVIGAVAAGIRSWLQAKLKPQQFNSVMSFATDAVVAADQAGDSLGWDGPQKYEYAQVALETLAKRVGMKLAPEETNTIIHAALKGFKDVTSYSQAAIDNSFQQGVDHGVNTLLTEIGNQVNAAAPAVDVEEPAVIADIKGSN